MKANPKVTVRANWSPAEHSLTAYFESLGDMAARLRSVDETAPRLIELLDPVTV